MEMPPHELSQILTDYIGKRGFTTSEILRRANISYYRFRICLDDPMRFALGELLRLFDVLQVQSEDRTKFIII